MAYNFLLELGGIVEAGFQEVSGLDATIDSVDYREGNQDLTIRKLPGLVKYSNITLKRGITVDNQAIWDWHETSAKGTTDRIQVAIVLVDIDGSTPKVRWELTEAWPLKWTGPSLNASSSAVAIETLEIVHEGITTASYS